MTRFPVSPKANRPLWQTLLAPMLLVSLGLHGLFLLIPVASSDEAVIPPPDPEQDNIAITRVPPAAPEAVSASPAPAVTPAPPQALQPQPAQSVALRPVPSPRQAAPARQVAPTRTPQSPPVSRSTAAAASPSPGDLPSLPGQGDRSNPSLARANPPSPAVPSPGPTLSPLNQDRRERILAYAASLDFPQERLDQLAAALWQRYGYSSLDTTRGEYTDNLTAWQETLQQETGIADLTAEEDRTDFAVSFERRACLSQPPGEVKVGFVVNPDGSFRQAPALLRSSGYQALNQKALDTIRQYEPPRADRIKAYTATVETRVDYGEHDCLSPPQQPSATGTDT